MNPTSILAFAAFAAALTLLLQAQGRLWAALAAVASGLQAAFALRLLEFPNTGVPVAWILALTLLGAGAMAWFGSSTKLAITAASVVMFAGAVQIATALL